MTTGFSFESERHLYTLNGEYLPSVTQLLEMGGLVKGVEFFTEASRRRGTAVHEMCSAYDLGARGGPVEPSCLGCLKAYDAAVRAIKPKYIRIEEASYHPTLRFAGRTDRVGLVLGRPSILEIKSGAEASYHAVQTALQAILEASTDGRGATDYQRLVLYLRPSGRFRLVTCDDLRDFYQAEDLIRRFCV